MLRLVLLIAVLVVAWWFVSGQVQLGMAVFGQVFEWMSYD